MRGKYKYDTSGLLNFAQGSYLERTSRPIYAIAFLLPFIVFHEVGTILINTDVLNQTPVRVVAFVWLQDFLEYIGLGSKLAWAAPALAVVVILVALQMVSRKRWRFWPGDIWPMAVECVLLAVPLIVLSVFLSSSTSPQFDNRMVHMRAETAVSCSAVASNSLSADAESDGGEVKGKSLLANIVIGIGAGIYEELIFRLILICALMILFQDVLGFGHRSAIIVSVLVSAGLFSAHHHIIFVNGQLSASSAFNWVEFVFRTIAGVYFAVVFAIRGFGITAGTHAFYDIIAVFLNSIFPQ